MIDPDRIATAYLDAWNIQDGEERRRHLSVNWTQNARYADPIMESEGSEGIAKMIDGVRSKFPGYAFVLDGRPQGHRRFVRLSWTLAKAGEPPVAHGTDVVCLDQQERIEEVIGFSDDPVSA